MNPFPGETKITLMADNAPSERCLHFYPGAVPDLDVEKYRLLVRGEGGFRVVRGHRAAGPPMKSVVCASNSLCEELAPGATNGQEFEVCISKARLGESFADISGKTERKLFLTLVVFIGGIAGAAGSVIGADGAIGALAALAILVGLGVGATALKEMDTALAIEAP